MPQIWRVHRRVAITSRRRMGAADLLKTGVTHRTWHHRSSSDLVAASARCWPQFSDCCFPAGRSAPGCSKPPCYRIRAGKIIQTYRQTVLEYAPDLNDRSKPADNPPLAWLRRCPDRGIHVVSAMSALGPLILRKRRNSGHANTSRSAHEQSCSPARVLIGKPPAK